MEERKKRKDDKKKRDAAQKKVSFRKGLVSCCKRPFCSLHLTLRGVVVIGGRGGADRMEHSNLTSG